MFRIGFRFLQRGCKFFPTSFPGAPSESLSKRNSMRFRSSQFDFRLNADADTGLWFKCLGRCFPRRRECRPFSLYSPSASEALLPRSPPGTDGDGAGLQDPSSPWEALLLATTPGPANARKKRAGFSNQLPSQSPHFNSLLSLQFLALCCQPETPEQPSQEVCIYRIDTDTQQT